MLTLYTYPISGNRRKVHMCLEEIGAQYEISRIDLLKANRRTLTISSSIPMAKSRPSKMVVLSFGNRTPSCFI